MGKIIQPLGSIDRNLNKEEIIELATEHATKIKAGQYDLLKVYIELKRYQLYLGKIINDLKGAATQDAKLQDERSFEYANAKVHIQHRTKYNYETDEKWKQLNASLEQLKLEKKEREQLLKQLTGDQVEVVNEETGEIERLVAPIKKVVDQIVVRL